jgi:hypothetical protein
VADSCELPVSVGRRIYWPTERLSAAQEGLCSMEFGSQSLDDRERSASRPGRFTPGKEPPGPVGQEAEWTQEQVWMRWRTEQFQYCPCWVLNSLVLTELPRIYGCVMD